jgi:hypothetical protein
MKGLSMIATLLFGALVSVTAGSQKVILRVCPEEVIDSATESSLCEDFEMAGDGFDMKSINQLIRTETTALIKKDWYDKRIREQKTSRGLSEAEEEAEGEETFESEETREATIQKDYKPATPTSISLRSLADGGGNFAKLNNLLNKVTIVIPDPDPIFAVDSDELTTLNDDWGGIGGLGLGFQIWASVTNIQLSRIQIGNLIFDHSKAPDNSFVEIDITLQDIGLEANINWAYWLCECYVGMECDQDEFKVSSCFGG